MKVSTNLQVGFGRSNINPPMGIDIVGYYVIRKAKGIRDDLEVNALAIKCADKKVVLITVDNCGIDKIYMPQFRQKISEALGISIEALFIHSTHTHTGPALRKVVGEEETKIVETYKDFVIKRCIDTATFALNDLKPAKMGYGVGQAPKIAFIRRFRMKDGSVRTNPGVNNPNIVEPIGQVDERASVVRFDREGAETIVLTNFANHPDTVGGDLISGDWPTLTRHFVEKAIDNTKCIIFNGAEGEVGS